MIDEPGSPLARRVLAEIQRHEEQQAARRTRRLKRAASCAGVIVAVALAWQWLGRDAGSERSIALAIEAARSSDAGVRQEAYARLARALRDGATDAIPGLVRGLSDPNPDVRRRVCRGLITSLPGAEAALPAALKSVIDELGAPVEILVATTGDGWDLLDSVATLTEEEQIFTVLFLIGTLDQAQGAPYIDFVAAQCAHPTSGRVRGRAIQTARTIAPNWEQIPVLAQAYLAAGDTDEKLGALTVMDTYGWSDLLPEVRALTSDPDPRVRSNAAITLASQQDTAGIPSLLPLIEDPVAKVRVSAAFALAKLGDESKTAVLTELARGNALNISSPSDFVVDAMSMLKRLDPSVAAMVATEHLSAFVAAGGSARLAAVSIDAVVAHPGAGTESLLTSLLTASDPYVAVDAAAGLIKLGSQAGAQLLTQFLNGVGCDDNVQRHAIRMAGSLGQTTFVPDLESIESSDAEEAETRQEASEAIEAIGSEGG